MKYALVTGGTKGIGRAIAEKLMAEGFYVYINYAHDQEAVENFLEIIEKNEWHAKFIRADLSQMDSIEILANEMDDKKVKLDALVLNVGVTDYTPFGEITRDVWDRILNTNLNVPFFLIQRMKMFMEQGGSITLISSVMGNYPHGRSIPYGVSKAGVNYLARLLVKEFSELGVRVNALSPGFTETDMQKGKAADHKQRIIDKVALHRFANPDEIADMVCSVINNTYINGANLEVDGGYSYF